MTHMKTLYVLVDKAGSLTGHALCEHCNSKTNRERLESCRAKGTTWRVLGANEEAWWGCVECYCTRRKIE